MKPRTGCRVLFAGLALTLLSAATTSTTSQLLNLSAPGSALPVVVAQMLDDGLVESGTGRGLYAISVEVDPPAGCQNWELYVRSQQAVFRSDQEAKPCSDLLWKLDSDGPASYQPLYFEDVLVTEGVGDRPARVLIDISVAVDWETAPGHYYLDLVYALVCR